MIKKQKTESIKPIDIKTLQADLPPKRERSHHIVVKLDNVSKNYIVGKNKIKALQEVDLTFYSGEFVIVYGPSGCGKSTFLHTVLGLEKPTHGKVYVREHDLYIMTNDARTNFRREKIGMVFQQSNFIKSLNVLENVAYPLLLSGYHDKEARDIAYKSLAKVQMEMYADHKSSELSGGQQQRISFARALTTNPWIIIADEPTGNLDSSSSQDIIRLLALLNREKRRTIIMVTHELSFLEIANRRVGMKDGKVINDERD